LQSGRKKYVYMSIKVKGFTKKYGSQIAVNDISFSIDKGEIVGFIGPNGSGKSTTMKCICGIIPPDMGQIEVLDKNIQEEILQVKKLIGYLPENNPLYHDMYVKEYLVHIDQYYNTSVNRRTRIGETLQVTGLDTEKNKKIGQLSKGYRQRVGLAQAIIHDPEVLILDEPTTGLDPNQILEIRNLISSLARNKTVLLSTHILQEVEAICDRIIIINKGILVADTSAEKIKSTKGESQQTIYLEFSSAIDPEIFGTIQDIEKIQSVSDSKYLIAGNSKKDFRELIFKFASEKNLPLITLQKKEETLEEAFRKLTRD
jgi:ABC-2 type transport system ATP-binding protein